jgi:Prephenate dehydratase.
LIIHTLGPEATDSNDAAHDYLSGKQGVNQVVLHDRFEDILDHLEDHSGDFLLIPAAFKSFRSHSDWADFHYSHLNELELTDCFRHPLNRLVIIRRQTAQRDVAYTHPSTAALLKNYLQSVHACPMIEYADSKYLAYQKYKETQARFVVTNERNVQLSSEEKIERACTPDMVWCVYQIKF